MCALIMMIIPLSVFIKFLQDLSNKKNVHPSYEQSAKTLSNNMVDALV